ncbi:DUF3141 domain-containing protein [Jannaschia marina]|uniref:DUF3141 domain-containing protein n=1 Tax=Jannaschia marina TaxID=2741674 RepID=UPI0015CC3F49|nr:DUF3141 domain-containing protein [Jannaschia marina]
MQRMADYTGRDARDDFALQQAFLAQAAGVRGKDGLTAGRATAAQVGAQAARIGAGLRDLRTPVALAAAWQGYLQDAGQRTVLTLDALRQWSDMQIAHEAAGAPPVLIYDYETILEGATLDRPSNYALLKITPPEGSPPEGEGKRPYVIIDPRAGHGPGIGGFKLESQVGVALADGHPVYFVAFHQMPEPGQTVADVTRSEAAFVAEVRRRHPESPAPAIVGNCQGGWATAVLAATHPALTGPIILNGAPMSYWAGRIGEYPMRYAGGLLGGVTPALLASDLGGGVFDGANLVVNFEAQNPGRNWLRKYYDLFRDIDGGPARFLEFERWWTCFYMMTGEEIRWIVENLFVGNRLAKNEAQLEPGVPIDLKAIRAPIICFASQGDNITPPAQALDWIMDTYADEREIEIAGQRIIYVVHETIGHLGIFVSSSVARREHEEFVSTLKTLEAFPPGLYEMVIEDVQGRGEDKRFEVSFARRSFEELSAVTGGRADEAAFAGAARASEALAEVYDTAVAPMLKRAVDPELAGRMRAAHPARSMRRAFASDRPGMGWIERTAETLARARTPVAADNPFLLVERLWADMAEAGWNAARDWKEAATEIAFLATWANPWAMAYGKPFDHTRRPTPRQELAPTVEAAIACASEGGAAAGIVRLLLLLAGPRGRVRLDRLERSSAALTTRAPFRGMEAAARAKLIHRQLLIVRFDTERAIETLPDLIRTERDRNTARDIIAFVLGGEDDLTGESRAALQRIHHFLNDAPQTAAE